ncbi:MAG: methyltransferase domain-containing protein [Armatimonadetes bacterium]|nr:methyltransferase domain-containing protein [Armatimonadota bacterium]MCX7968453.1 methyltransferase domain-containing protein [Armatimonadota bacterium]MDW8142780.1 methyltransferase domain-containing protein [Armatimonadota bacterium]
MEAVLDRQEVFKLGYHWVGDEEESAEQIEFVRRLLYLPVGSKVLMPFCGPGWYSHELAMWGFQVVGMEVVHGFLQEAKQRGKRLGLSTSFLQAEPLYLPFRDENFDGAMLIGNRFGMTGDELTDFEFLRELSRVIKPQGRLVAALPHRDGLLNSFQERDWETMVDGNRMLIFRKWDPMTGQMWEEWRDADVRETPRLFVVSYRVYTLTELERILRKVGFTVVNAFGNFMGGDLTYKSRWMVVQSVKE